METIPRGALPAPIQNWCWPWAHEWQRIVPDYEWSSPFGMHASVTYSCRKCRKYDFAEIKLRCDGVAA